MNRKESRGRDGEKGRRRRGEEYRTETQRENLNEWDGEMSKK